MSKLKLSGGRVGEFEDLGLVNNMYTSKLTVNGVEYLSKVCKVEADLQKYVASFRWRQDLAHFETLGVKILGEVA